MQRSSRLLLSLWCRHWPFKEEEENEEQSRKVEEKGRKRREVSALLAVACELRTLVQTSRIEALCAEAGGGPPKLPSQLGRRKRKKTLPRTSSFARAARTWKSGVTSTSPLYLTVLRPVSLCRPRSTRKYDFRSTCCAWFGSGYKHMRLSTEPLDCIPHTSPHVTRCLIWQRSTGKCGFTGRRLLENVFDSA